MALPATYTDLVSLLPKGQVTTAMRLGLSLSPDLDRDSWSRLVANLVQTAGRASGHRDTLTAWIGDVLAFGGGHYRGQITEYARAAGLAPGTLRDAKLVCSRIPLSSRRDGLSWSHHVEIGRTIKEPAEIERWLGIAEKGGHSKAEIRRMIRSHLAGARLDGGKPSSGPIAHEPFALLRELRAVGRFVRNHASAWKGWSPTACELALAEIEPISDLISQLKARAQSNAAQH